MADKHQQTEKPTPRRLHKARDEGNFPTARVFVSALQFVAFVGLLHAWGPDWIHMLRNSFIAVMQQALNPRLNAMDMVYFGFALLKQLLIPVGFMGGLLILLAVAIQLVVTGFGISLKKLTPDIQRLNPLARMRQLPRQNLSAALQAAIMLPVFGMAVYYMVADNLEAYLTLPLKNLTTGTTQVFGSIESLLWKASFLFVIFGVVDLVRQKSRYQRDLRMSKQEIRDESKEVDGNPMMKARIRRLRRDFARRRMMHEVPTATAVIVNPTHYAVALKYSMETRGAPKVVAKGKNYLALRVRQKALENQVPLIENPPLAQGLYKSVEVGQEIPAHFYKAVAEVLAYIFRIMNGRRTV
jgi:flagellar biosynthetic protein FlhB